MAQKQAKFKYMGTTIDVLLEANHVDKIMDIIESKIKYYEYVFSANDQSSELSSVNQSAGLNPVIVSQELFDLIEFGTKHSLEENSGINIAIGPLVQAWRIGFDDAKVITQKEVDSLLPLTDPSQIHLSRDERSVYLKSKNMNIDLGCLAKGYTADLILEAIKELGVKSCLMNFGGNILVYGSNPSKSHGRWIIGVKDPLITDKHRTTLSIKNESIVTSGIYERTYKGYHHILDPNTGYSVERDVASLSIIHSSSLICELWTTKIFHLDANEMLEVLKKHPELGYIIIKKDGTLISSQKGN